MEIIGKRRAILRLTQGANAVRNCVFGLLLLTLLAANSYAEPNVLKASAVPEPGVLIALGSGLVGLATVVRRHFSR